MIVQLHLHISGATASTINPCRIFMEDIQFPLEIWERIASFLDEPVPYWVGERKTGLFRLPYDLHSLQQTSYTTKNAARKVGVPPNSSVVYEWGKDLTTPEIFKRLMRGQKTTLRVRFFMKPTDNKLIPNREYESEQLIAFLIDLDADEYRRFNVDTIEIIVVADDGKTNPPLPESFRTLLRALSVLDPRKFIFRTAGMYGTGMHYEDTIFTQMIQKAWTVQYQHTVSIQPARANHTTISISLRDMQDAFQYITDNNHDIRLQIDRMLPYSIESHDLRDFLQNTPADIVWSFNHIIFDLGNYFIHNKLRYLRTLRDDVAGTCNRRIWSLEVVDIQWFDRPSIDEDGVECIENVLYIVKNMMVENAEPKLIVLNAHWGRGIFQFSDPESKTRLRTLFVELFPNVEIPAALAE